jgi:hypothetical protein
MFPEETIVIMNKIAYETENFPEYRELMNRAFSCLTRKSIAGGAFLMAGDLKAHAILTPSLYGNTPKSISRYHPEQYIIAVTPHPDGPFLPDPSRISSSRFAIVILALSISNSKTIFFNVLCLIR